MVGLTLEEIDSGMESLPESSKDLTPEKIPVLEDDYENEEDETLLERLLGLTEMFPQSVRNLSYGAVVGCKNGVKNFYGFSRSAAWILFSTSTILFAPLMFEIERVQIQTAQLNQQKQVLLGPNSAVSGGAGNPLGPGMPIMPTR
ncbi:mitochondrial import receptor subunit TOM22 homolog [Planococcus citri]|uniref:mitochondrial import receptor subunit TOM22 homolog n=1 Tax=Planococcus citri TaxID=170843 RepID=UPI0031F8717C